MATRIAINGFGRIGRLVFRALYTQGRFGKDFEVVAVGDIVPADNLAYLLKYDSIQGKFEGQVGSKKSAADKTDDDVLLVDNKEIQVRERQVARPSCPGRTWASTSSSSRPGSSSTRRRPRATSRPGPRRSSSPPRARTRTSPSSTG